MATLPVIQPSFAAGELSPFLYGRVDLAKFQVGARTLQNFLVHPHGGASNRPGTLFVDHVANNNVRHRLIPFAFRTLPAGQSYILVFGNKTMQVVMNTGEAIGFVLAVTTRNATAASYVNGARTIQIAGDEPNLRAGDRVTLRGWGNKKWNGTYTLTEGTDGNTNTLKIEDNNVGGPGTLGTVRYSTDRFEIATPYLTEDLPLLKYVKSGDTMTLTHPNYAARKLTRSGHAAWILEAVKFEPTTPSPTDLHAGTPGSAGYVVVTAISDSTGEESLPTDEAGASSATAGNWAWDKVNGCTNYNVYKKKGSVFGFVAQVQATEWTDDNIAPDISTTPPGTRNPFGKGILRGATITKGGSGYSGPTGKVIDGVREITTVTFNVESGVITAATLADAGQPVSAAAFVEITDGEGAGAVLTPEWSEIDENGFYTLEGVNVTNGGADYGDHPVIKYSDGGFGFGVPTFTATVDGGVIKTVTVGGDPLTTQAPDFFTLSVIDSIGSGAEVALDIKADTGNRNPSCSAYFLQRQAYANTLELPQTLWFTCAGAFSNMNVSSPTKDSDAITRTLTGQQVNEIRHLVPIGASLMLMTSGAEWRCWPGPSSNALTPAACFTVPQSEHGSSHVPPIVAGSDLLFIQEKGSRVRALRFDALQDQYQSFDMSILSQHMLHDTAGAHRIVEWAFAAEPYQIIWGVRDDGVLLGFTYMREHDVYAWHRHVTDGVVESVATVTEPDGSGGYEDAVYLIVARSLHGGTKRYVERMVSRTFPTIADAWFLDCALRYDGAATDVVTGLEHLQGRTVSVLADGNVLENQVVGGGQITLDAKYKKVIVGLPYTADLETLNLELQTGAGTAQGQMKKISKVTIRAKDARGVEVGINQGSLQEVKQRERQKLGSALQPFSGDYEVTIPSEWNRDGRVFVRQSYPLPVTILDLIPDIAPGR